MSAPASEAAVTRLEVRILGSLEVLRDGALVEIGPRKLRALLALLALNAKRGVSADRLIEELWAGRPPPGAAKTLRSYISRLRATVGDAVRSRPPGYVLAIEPEQLDAHRFERLLTEGRRSRAHGDPTTASASLRQALALWHGAALADLADEPFASVEAGRLEELRLAALEERIEADLECGRHHELAGELEALLSEQPLRERLWGQLMTALYRSGRQADALAAYQRARGVLADQFGLETGEELRTLEQKILRQELESAPASRDAPELPSGTVTFLFTGIAGSTLLVEELGERYADALAERRRVLRAVFSRHGGIEVAVQGDGLFVVFARANDAVAAAREAQEALGPNTPRVRIGIHTGEPILTDEGYVGIEVDRAARIMNAASGSQVLLSQTTRDLLDETVVLRNLGEHRLKDVMQPQHIYQLGDAEFPPLRTLHRTNLPVQLTSFVGREREREELIRLLPERPLVTLTGVGGCGKTRLALEAAGGALPRFPDGVVVVELAGLTESELVMHAVVSQLKAEQRSVRPLLEIIADDLRQQALLLVLDNCEHLLDGCAELVARLLRDCPHVRILATSREPLALPGELVYRVPPLAVTDTAGGPSSDAVRLFIERASVGGRQTDWNRDTLATVASICRELDGLPLAVELAAARTNVLSTQEIAARLDDRFRFLRYWRRGGEPRHETLGATMAWSYDLLTDDERALLRRLSVFAGGFTLDAATAVWLDGDGDAALTLLGRLIDASLVLAEPFGDRTRYRMLETVRHYALERLEEAGEEGEARGRHAAYFIEFAKRQCWDWQHDETPWANSWWLALEDDDNFRAALAWYVDRRIADASMRFVCWLTWFWGSTNRIAEGRRWCERALDLSGEAEAQSRAYGLYAAGMLSRLAGDLARAGPLTQQSLDLFMQLGDELGVAIALHSRAALYFISGELDASRADYEAALERFTDLARPWGVAAAKHGLAQVCRDLGDRETARSLLSSALDIDHRYPAALHSLGDLELDDGDLIAASRRYHESLSLVEVGPAGERVVTYCLAGLSCVAAVGGEVESAGRLWGALEHLEDKRGVKINQVERKRYERLMATVARSPTFEEAASVGRKLTLEQALDYARSVRLTFG